MSITIIIRLSSCFRESQLSSSQHLHNKEIGDSGVTTGWLLCLVTGAPLLGAPDKGPNKERKGQRGPRPEKVTGAPDGCVTPLTEDARLSKIPHYATDFD